MQEQKSTIKDYESLLTAEREFISFQIYQIMMELNPERPVNALMEDNHTMQKCQTVVRRWLELWELNHEICKTFVEIEQSDKATKESPTLTTEQLVDIVMKFFVRDNHDLMNDYENLVLLKFRVKVRNFPYF
jgi:hypothetical protein